MNLGAATSIPTALPRRSSLMPHTTVAPIATRITGATANTPSKGGGTSPDNGFNLASWFQGIDITQVSSVLLVLFIIVLISLRLRQQSKGRHVAVISLGNNPETKRSVFERKYVEISFLLIIGLCIILLVETNLHGWPATAPVGAITIWALWLGYSQFIDIRNENSIDKFYERLKITNQKLDEWCGVRKFAGPWYDQGGMMVPQTYTLPVSPTLSAADSNADAAYKITMYVCLELDNLECALVKYQAGYMSSSNTYRCIETFKHRCSSDQIFRDTVTRCLSNGRGYHALTKGVVNDVIDSCKSGTPPVNDYWGVLLTKDSTGNIGLACPICGNESVQIDPLTSSSIPPYTITFKGNCGHNWNIMFDDSKGRLAMKGRCIP